MTRALLLAALLFGSGCVATWAKTFPTYYEVRRYHDTESTVLICEIQRPDAVMVCADPAEIYVESCPLHPDGGQP